MYERPPSVLGHHCKSIVSTSKDAERHRGSDLPETEDAPDWQLPATDGQTPVGSAVRSSSASTETSMNARWPRITGATVAGDAGWHRPTGVTNEAPDWQQPATGVTVADDAEWPRPTGVTDEDELPISTRRWRNHQTTTSHLTIS